MAFKKFISVVLFILMLLSASKAEIRGVTETSKLGVTNFGGRKLKRLPDQAGSPCCYEYETPPSNP
ncbi:hypothetical protein ACB098_12G019100 [Castanea mollissima]